VLLSSHLMDEVEDLCDRVAIVSRGRVVYEGELDELISSTGGRYTLRTTDDDAAVAIASRSFDVSVNGVPVCVGGAAGADRSTVDLSGRAVAVAVDLHAGSARATVATNDLSLAYVHENSAYST